MSTKPNVTPWPLILLLSGLGIIGFVYSLAWSGTLLYDDPPNLNGLYGVSDWISGLNFILTGAAGPTGRPLSLLTFALQHASWPDPAPFLVANTVLHLGNALLVFLLARTVFGLAGPGRAGLWAAVLVAVLWAASPFLASASLMVVQRMTLLSATFVLLALWTYVQARTRWSGGTLRSAAGLAALAGTGTLLAGLAKENGFLLPVFLLLFELLLAPASGGRIRPLARPALGVILVAPVALIIGYLAYRGLTGSGYETRPFDLYERLLSQARALFSYLRHLLLPAPSGVTPFHDGFPASSGWLTPWTSLPALVGIAVLAGSGWLLRRIMPIVAFGILFFLGGHLLESTVVPLELYYPHRNYVPAVGLYLALASGLCYLAGQTDRLRRLVVACSSLYLVAFLGILSYGTSLWGNSWLSAEIWYQHNQDSLRASQFLAREYSRNGNRAGANRLLQENAAEYPGQPQYSLELLRICDADASVFGAKLERAIADLRQADFIPTRVANPIREYAATASSNGCEAFGVTEARTLIDAAWSGSDRPMHTGAHQHLLFARAQLAEQTGNYEEGIKYLKEALATRPNLDAVLIIAYFYSELGNTQKGIEFVEGIVSDPPVNFLNAIAWRNRLEVLLSDMKEDRAQEKLTKTYLLK